MTQFLGVGGLEKLLLSLMLEQKSQGHEPALMVYGEDQSWVEYFRSQGLRVINDYHKAPGYDWGVANFIADHWLNFDVIHSHDLNPAMYLAPLQLLRRWTGRKSPPWIHTAHGMDHIKQRPRTALYERFFTNQADYIVGVAGHVCETYQRQLGARVEKLRLIENGIALPTRLEKNSARPLLTRILGTTPKGKVWMCVSRVVPLKDQLTLLQAARLVPEASVIVVGPSGDEAYWQELQKTRPENAFLIGGHNNVSELLQEADYFVSASRHEGIPLAVLEAGAHQLPCVLSDIQGHRTLQKNENAIAAFFPVGDVAALASTMQAVMRSQTLAQELSTNLVATVKASFSARRMCDEYFALYQAARA